MLKCALTAALTIYSISLSAQDLAWRTLTDPPLAGRYDDMSFITPEKGWAVNSSGQVWHTENGGDDWEMQAQLPVYIRSVEFADSLNGWAGTLGQGSPILFNTTDGGQTWNPAQNLPNNSPTRVCGISMVGDSVIYACGAFDGPAIILKSSDSGQSWQAMDMRTFAGTMIDIHFFSPDTGIAVGGAPFMQTTDLNQLHAVVLYTTNGGDSWQIKYEGTRFGQWGWKIFFRDRNRGYISMESGEPAMALKTEDGGETWNELTIAGNMRIQGIGFLNAMQGWVGGWGFTSMTTDSGQTWEQVKLGDFQQDDDLNRFVFFGDSLMYASGKKILKYSNDNVTSVAGRGRPELPESVLLLQNYPNPFNPTTNISYTLPQRSQVRIIIYNSLGQIVRSLFQGTQNAGPNTIQWDGADDTGHALASGIYIYRLDAGQLVESRSMLLLK